eukprot:12081773-Heterocapsa_arctica.AAC.1
MLDEFDDEKKGLKQATKDPETVIPEMKGGEEGYAPRRRKENAAAEANRTAKRTPQQELRAEWRAMLSRAAKKKREDSGVDA